MPPKNSVRRYEDLILNYDLDFSRFQRLIRQRVYKSENGTIQTPITSLALAREYTGERKAPVGRDFTPRTVLCCFINPNNQAGVSELKAIVLYRPTDTNLNNHVQEILDYPGVETGFYTGEVHKKSTEPYTRQT